MQVSRSNLLLAARVAPFRVGTHYQMANMVAMVLPAFPPTIKERKARLQQPL